MSETLVELVDVTKSYGDVTAVNKINLTVDRGEFLVLLGPSGSGKTTILSIMGGFTTPTEGQVIIDDEDVTSTSPAQRPTVTVFQDYALFPHMSVRDNVAFGLAMRKVPKAERLKLADKSLETVGLSDFGNRGVHELSGGQRQRVALARAITVEPTVLLLDEPLGALDLKIRRRMQDELVHLQKKLNATFVHVTHDQEEAMSIADNIALINEGRIEDYGPPDRVYLRPATLFTAKFMGDSNILEGPATMHDSENVRVETELGPIVLPGQVENGSTVYISLRPEQVKLRNSEDDGLVSLGDAKVTEVVFQGTHKSCRALAGVNRDVEFLFRVLQDKEVEVDDVINIYAQVSDMVLLKE